MLESSNVAVIYNAAVGAFFTVVGGYIGYRLQKSHERRLLQPMADARRKALTGKWLGTIDQPPRAGEIRARFNATGKELFGEADITRTDGERGTVTLSLKGGFLHGRFLKLEYTYPGDGTIGFGSIVLDFAASGRTLKGKYVGCGPATQGIVYGDVSLTKEQSSLG